MEQIAWRRLGDARFARGGSGGHADELVSAGHGHARLVNVARARRYPASAISMHQAIAAPVSLLRVE